MRYRPAIDGLRALAIILVLLFHAKVPLFSGGYVGVDVFFVISGYLIATLILHDHVASRFALAGFYERRIRRIFPALFLVILSTLAMAAIVMLPPDLTRLGSSVVASALYVGNFYFWAQRVEYLHGDQQLEPLLHTWSLAIEEQYYLLFPIFMLMILRFTRRLDLVFFGLTSASLAISVYLTLRHPTAAFYFSSSRAWELLLGAWLAVTVVTNRVPRRILPALQLLGLVMIAGAAVSYDAHMSFPGLAALLPCVGTALLIAWSHRESRIIRGLSFPALVWLGLISYPLYLWHWPLLVLAKYVFLRRLDAHEIAVVYIVAVALAMGTWHFLEKPVRARQGWSASTRRVFVVAAAVSCIAVAIGGSLRATVELWGVPPPKVAHMLAATKDYAPLLGACQNWDRKSPNHFADCTIGSNDRSEFDFALWGDSHAGAIATAVDGVGRSLALKGLQMTSDDCLPLLVTEVLIQGAMTDCRARNEAAFDQLRQHHIRRAILVGAWIQYVRGDFKTLRPSNEPKATVVNSVAAFQQGLKLTIGRLQAAGIEVVLVGPVPEIGWDVPSVLAASEWRGKPLPSGPSLADFEEDQRKVMIAIRGLASEGVAVVYPHERLCQLTCMVYQDAEVLYRDNEHLTTRGAELLRPMFLQQLSRPPSPVR